jgi:acyl-CoA reductase-like NAD-dependent aldehyde dehydrogenase
MGGIGCARAPPRSRWARRIRELHRRVINDGARRTILQYIETGKQEVRMLPVGVTAPDEGYFVPPTVIADVDAKARIFQEEIFGPVLPTVWVATGPH